MHQTLPADLAGTLGRVYGGDRRLVHIPDRHRADIGREMAAWLDARMRSVQTFDLPPDAPLCPGCYMVALIDCAVALAKADGQDGRELGLTLAGAFMHIAEFGHDPDALPYTEEVKVVEGV